MFVRIDEEIIELGDEDYIIDEQDKLMYGHKRGIFHYQKTSESLEEVCDRIVVKENSSSLPVPIGKVIDYIDKNGKKYYTGEYSFKGIAYTLKELMERYKEMSIKGAIWTDKGLIYVAKMNDEGVLELL